MLLLPQAPAAVGRAGAGAAAAAAAAGSGLLQIILRAASGNAAAAAVAAPGWWGRVAANDLLLPAAAAAGACRAMSVVTGHTHVPRTAHDRYRSPPKNYVQLLQHIARSRDVVDLSRLVTAYGPRFDAVHVAAALSRMPKLYSPPPPQTAGHHLNMAQRKARKRRAARLLAHLQAMAGSQVPRMFARQVAAITSALARCDSLLPGGGSSNPATQQLLAAMLERVTRDNGRLLWQGASGPSVSHLLYGLARFGYAPAGSSSSGSGGSSVSASGLARTATHQLCCIIARHPERLHTRELAAAAWALGRIHKRQPGILGISSSSSSSSSTSSSSSSSAATADAAGDDGPQRQQRFNAAEAALDVISREVQERRLWLRPDSMAGLLAACVWLRRRDQGLLDAIAEEAVAQQRDLRPRHLAVLAWAPPRLRWTPPPALLDALTTQAAAQLRHFDATSLGLLLQGQRRLGVLDDGLLAQVAAGIACEQQVALGPRDAARILAAFVAAPRAGTLRDVAGMAERVGTALMRAAPRVPPSVAAELLFGFSKLGHHHPVLLRLFDAVAQHEPASIPLGQWVNLLQAAARLGLNRAMADPQVEAVMAGFYDAAEHALQAHLRGAALPGSPPGTRAVARPPGASASQQQQKQKPGLWQKLKRVGSSSSSSSSSSSGGAADEAAAEPGPLHPLQFTAAVDIGSLLAERGALSEASAGLLAESGGKLLPGMKLRLLWLLLTAVTSREKMLVDEDVRQLLVASVERLRAADLGAATTSATVLMGFTLPVARAVSRHLAAGSGEALLQSLYEEVSPMLDDCSREQLLPLWAAMHQAGVDSELVEGLRARTRALAQQRGWQLPGSLGMLQADA